MSDSNLNNASFTPEINDSEESTNKQTYSATGSFRFWCQKVLPLVYDDSLSYYELLCKVVNYLNSVIQNVDNLNTSVDNTNTAFNNLQNYVNTTKATLVEVYGELEQYVNNYFNNLNVQAEINSKLDSMAEDGSLSDIISPFIPSIVTDWLSENITPTSPAIDASLSVSGAGADAKVTGDRFSELNDRLVPLAGNSGLYLNTIKLPAENEIFSYDVNIKEGTIPRKLYIKNNSSGAYYAYGLYNGNTLVWGLGVEGSDDNILVYVGANSQKEFDIPLNINANTFKIRNRNSNTDTNVTIQSDIVINNEYVAKLASSIISNIAKAYDGTTLYKVGDVVEHDGKIYICTIGSDAPSERFQSTAFKETTIDELYKILKSLLFTSKTPWEQGSINYYNGELSASTSRTRTVELSNIATVQSEYQSFGVLGYYNGTYVGMYDNTTGEFVMPTESAILTKYADLSKFGFGYKFRLLNYTTGDASASSRIIEILEQRYISIANEELLKSIANTIPNETIIEVGAGKTYTSLRTALEYAATIASKNNIVTVQFYGNGVTYNVMNDITSADLATTSTWVGLSVPAYTKLVGMGSREQNIISLELPSGTDPSTIFRISAINLYENAELENLWVIGKNCRYACHDDMMGYNPDWKLKTVKNCRFTSNHTDQHRAYGAGYRSGVNWRFENCIFENINGEAEQYGNAAFSAHNNNGMIKSASITFVNCQFIGGHGVGFESLNNTNGQDYANAKTIISFYGCKAIAKRWDYPVIASLPTDTIHNAVLEVCITGCANNFGFGDVKVYSKGDTAFVDTFNNQISVWGKIDDNTWNN